MSKLFDLTALLSSALSAVAKILIGVMITVVVADVALRNVGGRPLSWGVTLSEYILLYSAFLPMPWLVHSKGHVFVEFLRNALPAGGRLILEKAVYVTCIVLCVYLGVVALMSLVDAVASHDYETRTFDMPKWAIFAPMVLAFFMSALEWLRYLLGYDTLYNLDPLEVEGL